MVAARLKGIADVTVVVLVMIVVAVVEMSEIVAGDGQRC